MSINNAAASAVGSHRRHGVVAVVGLGMSAAVFLAGCGGSKAPTRAAFNQQASAICTSVNKKTDADGNAADKASTPKQAAAALQSGLDDTNQGIKQLKALKEPKGDNSHFEAALSDLDQGSAQLQKLVNALKSSNQSAAKTAEDALDPISTKTDNDFKAAGLPACAAGDSSDSSGG